MKKKMRILSIVCLLLITGALSARPLTAEAAGTVSLSLQPGNQTVNVGDTFDVVIQVVAGTQQVVGVDAYLDFDATKLAVVDVDANTEGVQITSGRSLSTVIMNSAGDGRINFSAGKLGEPYPNGTFTLGVIRFQALTTTSSATSVSFATSMPRTTLVLGDPMGGDVTGILAAGSYTVLTPGGPALTEATVPPPGVGGTNDIATATTVNEVNQTDTQVAAPDSPIAVTTSSTSEPTPTIESAPISTPAQAPVSNPTQPAITFEWWMALAAAGGVVIIGVLVIILRGRRYV